jgi:Mrp family chromosome partitioning ATPase/capsular polysaccharide biosynthesis protein
MKEVFANRPTTLADYRAVIRRRKWVVIVLPVVAAATAWVLAHGQSSLYRATAQVLVSRSNAASAVTSVDPTVYDATRFLATQADIARSPEVAARVVKAADVPGVSPDQLLGETSIAADPNADVLYVSVSSSSPSAATRLTNAYAEEYARYKTSLDTEKIDAALQTLGARTKALRSQGGTASPGFGTLDQYQTQLETIRTLVANSVTVLRPAGAAGKVQPKPMHTALLGGLVGLVLGLGLAFLLDTLDPRVRSEDEIESVLGIPLLGRIPPPPRHLQNLNGLIMVAQPGNAQAEAFRRLKTSIEFVNREHDARTIMVTSAVPREGKSTTIANLAVAFARSGRRVALVDLDLRQPSIHPFFSSDRPQGITDVLVGNETLEGALRPRFLPSATSFTARRNGTRPTATSTDPAEHRSSLLTVLPAGTLVPASGDTLTDLLESEMLASVFEELGEQFEVVLADTPPLLVVGDAIPLSSRVDAVLMVLHTGIRRPVLHELARELEKSQAPILGFVLTGVGEGETYGSTYGYVTPEGASSKQSQPARLR